MKKRLLVLLTVLLVLAACSFLGVTPEMSPAQKAASPASVTPISPRKRGRNAMTPIIAIPAPTWMAHIRYTIRFQPVFFSIAPPSLLSF